VSDYCRDLKHQLSEQSTASVYITMGLGQVESFELTRVEFEEMIAPLIEDTLDCCDQLVRSAGKNWQQVNRLLLVGGSSRIPYVKEAIEKRLEISPFLVDKPELAVCLGAAINDSITPPDDIIQNLLNSGDALYQQGKLEEAIAEYEKALNLEPNNLENNQRIKRVKEVITSSSNAHGESSKNPFEIFNGFKDNTNREVKNKKKWF
jgi:tetratricopeptide (TPR) repeat protein